MLLLLLLLLPVLLLLIVIVVVVVVLIAIVVSVLVVGCSSCNLLNSNAHISYYCFPKPIHCLVMYRDLIDLFSPAVGFSVSLFTRQGQHGSGGKEVELKVLLPDKNIISIYIKRNCTAEVVYQASGLVPQMIRCLFVN